MIITVQEPVKTNTQALTGAISTPSVMIVIQMYVRDTVSNSVPLQWKSLFECVHDMLL